MCSSLWVGTGPWFCASQDATAMVGAKGSLKNNEFSILYHCFQWFFWLQRKKQFLLPFIFSMVIFIWTDKLDRGFLRSPPLCLWLLMIKETLWPLSSLPPSLGAPPPTHLNNTSNKMIKQNYFGGGYSRQMYGAVSQELSFLGVTP